MSRRIASILVLALLIVPARLAGQSAGLTTQILDGGLRARSIGPAANGGRIHEIEALGSDPSTIYVAAAGGGIWKTTNKGVSWRPIFDHQGTSTFGDVAISPANPQIVWAGTGEQNNRQSTSWGDGVYRSTNGGESWTHVGLTNTRHIGKIMVHPTNADVAWVAALGNLWAPSADRGVFKTSDGGRTWEKVLFVDTLTGVVDLVIDPSDPNTLYAASYQRMRQPWGFNGGGPGSGIHKTTDGGRTWRKLTTGLPPGQKGRIGIAIAASNPRVLNAIVEAEPSATGVYRSTDAGESWTHMSSLNPRPMYYSHIYIDPKNDQRVYVISGSDKSDDGGRTWTEFGSAPTYDVGVHGDHHTIWIDPNDTDHIWMGNDGGLYETYDRGLHFEKVDKLVVAQFYAIGVDHRDPYFVYGGTQDTHSWMGPSATRSFSGIMEADWIQMGFGDGMYNQPEPTGRYVFVNSQNGALTRVEVATGDIFTVRPTPLEGEAPYRFEWTTPSLISQHDPRSIYFGGNRFFMSRDMGLTWTHTDDLTKSINPASMSIMGVPYSTPSCSGGGGGDGEGGGGGARPQPRTGPCILSKGDGVGSYSQITTVAESPIDPAILWVGVDDGNVQVSRNAGQAWTEVSRNIRGVPTFARVSRVTPSGAGPGVAYVTYDNHHQGDFAPYIFRTRDFGATWEPMANGLPSGSVNVIKEHPKNPNLLFVGTEHSVFVSADAGANWVKLEAGLPTTLYDDMVIHPRDDDLVLGTHGRGIWIVDDITPLAEWTAATAQAEAALFSIQPATIFNLRKNDSYQGNSEFNGDNPPFGATITYYLARAVPSARISIANRQGTVVRTIDGPTSAGMHRVVWDMRHPEPPRNPGGGGGGGGGGQDPAAAAELEARYDIPIPLGPRGPFASPGTYRVTLEAGAARQTKEMVLKGDPLMSVTQAEYEAREQFLVGLQESQRRAIDGLQRARATGDNAIIQRFNEIVGRLSSLASEFNGGAIRPGSILPPGPDHVRRKLEAERVLDRLLDAL